MKKVFSSNAMLAHVWAQQKQEFGRGNSMFFEGDSIYSFGLHYTIARFHGDVVLVNSRGYSSCTARHTNHVTRAISHKEYFGVPNVNVPKAKENVEHLANLVSDGITRLINAPSVVKSWRSLSANSFSYSLSNIRENVKTFNAYCKTFGIKDRIELPDALIKELKDLIKAKKERAKVLIAEFDTPEAKAKREKEQAKREAAMTRKQQLEQMERQARAEERERQNIEAELKAKADLQRWLDGASIKVPYTRECLLRIKGNEVQTTQGAVVPLSAAKQLLMRIRSGAKVDGVTVGDFTVTELTKDALIVGCHEIPLAEINRVFA